MSAEIREAIKLKGKEIGFDVVRLTKPIDKVADLKEWLANGYHGEMDWLAKNPKVRGNAQNMWKEVETVISVGYNYGPGIDPLENLKNTKNGNIACYAWHNDYHDIIKKKLKEFGNWIARTYSCELKVFVDTAPVMERPLAQAAGMGWQGKHTCLVSREFGSWLFLGAIYITKGVEPDTPEVDHCGKCSRCVDACPTNAFVEPYVMDARRCISYLTIEYKGAIPDHFKEKMGNRIYGCDDCLAVCPWNKFAQKTEEIGFWMRDNAINLSLSEYAKLDDASFREMFRKSPIKRIGINRFLRNVLIAMGNSNDIDFLENIKPHLSSDDPTVQDSALWAYERLQSLRGGSE